MNLIKAVFTVICGVALGGCAISFQPPQKFYDGPELARGDVAIIHVVDSWDHTGNRLNYDWISHVLAVDGRPTNGRWFALKPGSYTLTMACEVNPSRYPGSPAARAVSVKITARSWNHYHPWCGTRVDDINTSYAGTPGMQIAQERYVLYATPYMDTKRAP